MNLSGDIGTCLLSVKVSHYNQKHILFIHLGNSSEIITWGGVVILREGDGERTDLAKTWREKECLDLAKTPKASTFANIWRNLLHSQYNILVCHKYVKHFK